MSTVVTSPPGCDTVKDPEVTVPTVPLTWASTMATREAVTVVAVDDVPPVVTTATRWPSCTPPGAVRVPVSEYRVDDGVSTVTVEPPASVRVKLVDVAAETVPDRTNPKNPPPRPGRSGPEVVGGAKASTNRASSCDGSEVSGDP